MNIAQRLQELLEKTNTSRSKLARDLGVHTSTVSNWLDGKDVKAENLATLCEHFDCSISYLTSASDNVKEKAPTQKDERYEDPDIRRIERARKNMSDQDKQKMMNILIASFEDYFSDDYQDDDVDE